MAAEPFSIRSVRGFRRQSGFQFLIGRLETMVMARAKKEDEDVSIPHR